MIRDFDDTKMYLVIGSTRALDVVITHGHPDHIAAMGQFQDRYNVYMNQRDLPMVQSFVERLGFQIDLEQIDDLQG